MPSERKSKEDTWTPSELKRAMGKDTIRREREEKKKERLREEQNGEERHRRRKDEDERHHHRDEDERKRHKDKDRHQRNDDEGRRRRRDRESPDRIEMTEEERERQRRERREKRDGKSKGDDRRKRPADEEDSRRRHRDEEKDRERRHKDDDRRRQRDEDDDRRRHKEDGERRRHRDDEDREKKRHRDDGDRRRQRDEDDRERRKHHQDEDERDRRKRDKDRHKESEEEERERQRRERREKRDGKDSRDKDRDRERRQKEERAKSSKSRDIRTKSSVNGGSKQEEKEEENPYDDYEDDFEDYEEDFEEEEEEEAPRGKTSLSTITPREPRHGLEYSDDEMNQVLQALDEENDRLYNDSKRKDRYDRTDSPEDRGRRYRDESPDEPVTTSHPKTGVINFLSAKRQVMTQKAYGKTSKRARDLLEMIELDTVTFDIMDLPPVKEYDLYIRSYGRSDTRQAYVQTNDDAIERDIQTDEIDMRNKWTQHPAEDFAGSGRGDGEKDFEEEEQSQHNKQQDLGRLSKFIQQAGQVVSILMDEERSQETTELSANKSNISLSEGYTELSMLSILQGRHVEFAYFAPTQPNMVLTVYSEPKEGNPSNPTYGKGIICVWNTNEPSYPQRILACESQPRCCCFSPYKTSLAFAGMVDGSICAWDLREPPSLHRSVEFEQTEHLLRFPTYNTAGISESDNHISPVRTISPVITYIDENSQQESDSAEDSGSGMSFQLVSSEDQGTINFWVVAEITNPDMAGSEIDLGMSPGGKIKVVISSSIKVDSLVRESRSLGPLRTFEMQISPTDPNHFYIGTDGGCVLHGLRFGNRAFPRTFTTLADSPVDVRNIDFSPFGHPCFLVTTTEGCVHLFGTKTDKPLLSWQPKIWGTRNLKCVRWSRSRPCVFYVLDERSQLYTFDVLEGDAMPIKTESLSKQIVTHIAFSSHQKTTGKYPQMLISKEDGSVQIHTIAKEYREQQTLENDFLPSYLERF